MRRPNAIVMLALLPFQFSCAAAASCCRQEMLAEAVHFIHHSHQHHADASDW